MKLKALSFCALASVALTTACDSAQPEEKQALTLNDLEYFEEQGVNVLV